MTDSPLSNKILQLIIKTATILILFLPLVVTSGTFFPYIFGKAIFFQILVEIAALAWTYLMIFDRRYRPSLKNPLVVTVLAYVGSVLLSGFFGVDPVNSFWSNHERMGGGFMQLHLGVFAIMTGTVFRERSAWNTFFAISVGVSVLVGLYGMAQLAHLPIVIQNSTGTRLSSTLGNPIYLGVYALTHIWISLYLMTQTPKRVRRGALFIAALFLLYLVVLSGSRAAIIVAAGSVAAVVILSTGLFFAPRLRKRRVAALLVSLGIVVVCIGTPIIIFRALTSTAQPPEPLRRIATFGLIDRNRFELWSIGMQGFFERPFLGWGAENYSKIYYKYALPEHNGVRIQEAWFDRSHNQIVDVLALYGVLGLVGYAAVFFFLCMSLYRFSLQGRSERLGAAMIAGAILSYFIQNLVVFDSTIPVLLFYILVGFLISVRSVESQAASSGQKRIVIGSIVCSTALTFGVLICIIGGNIMPYIKSVQGIRAVSNVFSQPERSFAYAQEALDMQLYVNPEIRRAFVGSLPQYSDAQSANPMLIKKAVGFAREQMQRSVQEHPGELRDILSLIALYRIEGFADERSSKEVLEYVEKALALAPNRLDALYEAALTYATLGYADRARETSEAALILDAQNARSIMDLAHVEYLLRDYSGMMSYLRRGLEHGTDPKHAGSLLLSFIQDIPSESLTSTILKDFHALAELTNEPLFLAANIIALSKSGDRAKVAQELASLEKKDPALAHALGKKIEKN